jgi:SAM-dependent methyltransferase
VKEKRVTVPGLNYLMESEEEALRLDLKTEGKLAQEQASWAGLAPGMSVADLGCGPGKTTYYLNELVQPGGRTAGVDISEQRILYAKEHYGHRTIEYVVGDIREPLNRLGAFDFIWLRFVLEYYRSGSFDIVKNVSSILKPGGIMCLVDLDCNCLRHFGLSARLEKAIAGIMESLSKTFNFDPYMGVKLYSFLHDLRYQDIQVHVTSHNLKTGNLKDHEIFNWTKKAEIAGKRSNYQFENYPGGFREFYEDFKVSFADPRVFYYTPLIVCKGTKPLESENV